uniref:Uncharacterized protein n=1 Tax=Arundo donax TaxID=35708 RepID=A0A0A9EK39_ARUDO
MVWCCPLPRSSPRRTSTLSLSTVAWSLPTSRSMVSTSLFKT